MSRTPRQNQTETLPNFRVLVPSNGLLSPAGYDRSGGWTTVSFDTIPAGDSAFSLYGALPGRPHLSTPYASLMERDMAIRAAIMLS